MRKIIIFIVCLISVQTVFSQGTLVDTSFFSSSLGFNRNVAVYLPEGYDPNGFTDYPVIYFLHGAGGNQSSYPEIIGILDTLIDNQVIAPVIVVKPDGHIGPYAGSMYTNSELYGNFEDYIVCDLTGFIDSSFRSLPNRENRCIMGHSMGGIGSMNIALKYPGVYSGVASLSGVLELNVGATLWTPHILTENGGVPPYSYHPFAGTFSLLTYTGAGAFSPNLNNLPFFVDFPLDSNGNIIDSIKARWNQHNPPHLATLLPPGSGLSIYFDCGTYDHLECHPMNTAFADSLDLLGITYQFHSYSGDHYDPNRLPIAIAFLDSVINSTTTISNEYRSVPRFIMLNQNYPNPFNVSTSISFSLSKSRFVKVTIYDLLGREIQMLLDEYKQAGKHAVELNMIDLSTGIYFYKLQAGDFVETKRMVLLK